MESGTTGVFGRAAASYGAGPDLFGYFGKRIVRLVRVERGQSVLDVACGTGRALEAAGQLVGSEGRAVGVDLTKPMAAQARARGLTVAVMDADALGFPSGTFDTVISNFALTYFADPLRTLAECRRVLRPEGRLGLVVHDGWWWQDDPRWEWHVRLFRELANAPSLSKRRFSNPDDVVSLATASGFTATEATIEPFDLRWSDAGQWWEWCWSQGYRAVLEAFDAITLDEYRTSCFAQLGDGPVEGTLPVILLSARAPV